MNSTHVDALGRFQITLESLNVGAANQQILFAIAVISNALKTFKENKCISRVSYTVPVIFMTITHVDNFGGLKISLESLILDADNSTVSCLLLPLFQKLLRNKRKIYAFHMYLPQRQSFL